jgi:mycothione reductase
MKSYDLIVLGAGSGNMLLGPETAQLRSAIVEPDRFGGTCLNRGCIPSKMFVVAADAALGVHEAARLGVHAKLEQVDWPAIRRRVFDRIDPIHDDAVRFRRKHGIDVYTQPARFVSPRVLDVGGDLISAEQIVVAVGARPVVPDIPGLQSVPFHTSDTIMRIDALPRRLLVLGGGFIAAELGHVFAAFGTDVTIVQRGPRLLMAEDGEISTRFTAAAARRHRVLLDAQIVAVRRQGELIAATVRRRAEDGTVADEEIVTDTMLVAAGRRPNTDLIDSASGGLALDAHGHVVTDDVYRTSVPGVWSFGDAANHFQLKHMANAEMRVLRHNLLHPADLRTLPHRWVPHAVFSHPQVASVGLTEEQAEQQQIPYLTSVRHYADTAYGWALEDTDSIVKLVADPHRRTLLGAHIIGPQAATLIQPLLQGMMLGQTVDQLAHDVLYIHPALTEVVEQALLELRSAGSSPTSGPWPAGSTQDDRRAL